MPPTRRVHSGRGHLCVRGHPPHRSAPGLTRTVRPSYAPCFFVRCPPIQLQTPAATSARLPMIHSTNPKSGPATTIPPVGIPSSVCPSHIRRGGSITTATRPTRMTTPTRMAVADHHCESPNSQGRSAMITISTQSPGRRSPIPSGASPHDVFVILGPSEFPLSRMGTKIVTIQAATVTEADFGQAESRDVARSPQMRDLGCRRHRVFVRCCRCQALERCCRQHSYSKSCSLTRCGQCRICCRFITSARIEQCLAKTSLRRAVLGIADAVRTAETANAATI